MALIKCPECNKEISDKATSCPGCGCPIGTPPTVNVNVNQERHQFYNELPAGLRTRETILSLLALALSFFPFIGYAGLLLAILDLKLDYRKQYKHSGSIVAIVISICWTIYLFFNIARC